MADDQRFTFGVKGPDADDVVWLRYDSPERRGLINLGGPGDPDADLALNLGGDSSALERSFGRLVFERVGRYAQA